MGAQLSCLSALAVAPMDEIEMALCRQIALGPSRAPLDPGEVAEAGESSARVRLLLALTDDEALHAEWARRVDYGSQDAFGRAAWLRAEIDRVDETVDEMLAANDGRQVLELLARCEIPWAHEAIERGVDDPATRPAASLLLARSTPDELRRIVLECEVVEDAVTMLRAAALVGAEQFWAPYIIWRDRIEELTDLEASQREDVLRRLDASGAALDPTLFARGLLAGDYGDGWLGEPYAVADFLQIYGPTDWLEVAADLEWSADDALEMASTMAVAAAQGIGSEPPPDDEVRRLLDLLAEEPKPNQKERPWEGLAARLGYGFQMALGGENDEFAMSLAQAAAHERLVTHGIHSPGIRGLPLSATSSEDFDADQTREVVARIAEGLSESEGLLVSAVRTLCDGRDWARRDAGEYGDILRETAEAFESTDHDSVRLARERLSAALDSGEIAAGAGESGDTPLDDALVAVAAVASDSADAAGENAHEERLAEAASDSESLLGLDCIRQLGEQQKGGDALEHLGRLWLHDAPVSRAPFARRVLVESIALRVDEPSDS